MVFLDLPDSTVPALTLYADGGTIGGSPGRGIYYSFGNKTHGIVRKQDVTGKRRRSDEAEFLALLSALRFSGDLLKDGETLLIHMDCRLVVRAVRRQIKPRPARLRALYWDVQEVLARLVERGIRIVLRWVKRTEMVKVLGH